MLKLVFLLEEPSMKNALDHLLPQILPPNVFFKLLPHEGKSDLKRSIPRKLQGWREPGVIFVIVLDKDKSDCHRLKQELVNIAEEYHRPDTLVRIVCQELESWFLGDFDALERAYAVDLASVRNKARYRNPDSLGDAKEELKRIIPAYQQGSGSDRIAAQMKIVTNSSHSFHVFVSGVKTLCEKAGKP
ncbi:MAG: DUF4276 family protein [Coriobacteriales bacterium]|jgi:hypothetical protein|nr:DUF4276 family protein [Coriobacteriales bacterium]